MSDKLQGIAADLEAANTKLDNVKADIQNLDAQIAALGDAPTDEEIAALKAQSSALVDKISGIDDMTPDVTAPPPAEASENSGESQP